jgi:sulfonate transport system substrate-binding protein
LILKELANVGAKAQANIDATAKSLASITGVPEDVTKVSLTRSGADLGRVSLVPDQAIAYQQALADEFYDLKIVPKKLNVADIVWRPKAS